MNTDPISDMLTRIRNAQAVKKTDVVLSYSKMKEAIANILSKEGYIAGVETQGEDHAPSLRLKLKYDHNRPVIKTIKRVSTPGRRVYAGAGELPRVMSDLGIAIISTSNGLMTNKEARSRKLGGEVICEVA